MKIQSVAGDYLRESNWERSTIRNLKRFETTPSDFKQYPECKQVPLTFSWNLDEARIKLLIQNRRSLRKYSQELMTIDDVSFIMWASQGITAKVGKHFFRSVPSAGALYPYESYLVLRGVQGLEDGLYHFNIHSFSLEQLRIADLGKELSECCLNQKFIEQAPITIIWTGVQDRCMGKYGERALRYLLLDLGHICQNALIGAEALGAGGCPIAAFFDEELNTLLGVDGDNEMALYAASIGRKPKK